MTYYQQTGNEKIQHIHNQENKPKKILTTHNGVNIHMAKGNHQKHHCEANRQHAGSTMGPQTEQPLINTASRPMNQPLSTQSQSNLEFEEINDQKSNFSLTRTININSHNSDPPSPQNNTSQNGNNTKSTKTTLNASARVFIPKGHSNKTIRKYKVMETITEQNESDADGRCPNGNDSGGDSRYCSKYLPFKGIDVNPYQIQHPQMPPVFKNNANVWTQSQQHLQHYQQQSESLNNGGSEIITENIANTDIKCCNDAINDESWDRGNTEHKSYKPTRKHIDLPNKLKSIVAVPFDFTSKYIPERIEERIHDVYSYMDKAMAFKNNKKVFENIKGNIIVIINFGFHSKYGEELFCVMEQDNSGKRKWRMKKKLFDEWDIWQVYGINVYTNDPLPSSYASHVDRYEIDESVIKNSFDSTKWSRVPIYAKRRTKVKQRRVLHITNQEFMKILRQQSINHNDIITIISFNGNATSENVIVVRLTEDVTIGISYQLQSSTNILTITGIYLDKDELLTCHQLSSPDHKCHCLNHFVSNIDELKIGNVYDEENKIKALQKENKTPIMKYIKQVLKQSNKLISDNIKTALLSIKNIFNFDTIKQAIENCPITNQNHSTQSQPQVISSKISTYNMTDKPMQYLTTVQGNVATTIPLPQQSAIT